MTPQEQLCEKMRVEQSAYCLWLTAQLPEEILHHAYEYSVREDIILATEEMNLTPAQVRALLKSPAPLADVYKDFSKLETDYMSIVAQCVEDRADDLLKKEQQQNQPKVYRQSVTYAREHGELPQYHASCHLNERCRDEIDAALAQRFDGMRLGAGAVEQVVAEYGLERTKYVLAAAIQTRDGDGRISRTNREWADSIRTIKDMDRRGFDRSCYYADLQAHTCLLEAMGDHCNYEVSWMDSGGAEGLPAIARENPLTEELRQELLAIDGVESITSHEVTSATVKFPQESVALCSTKQTATPARNMVRPSGAAPTD